MFLAWMTEYLLRSINLNQPAKIKERRKVGAPSSLLHIMRYDDDRKSLLEQINELLREMQPGSLFQETREHLITGIAKMQLLQFRHNPTIAFAATLLLRLQTLWLSAASIRYPASSTRWRSFGQISC